MLSCISFKLSISWDSPNSSESFWIGFRFQSWLFILYAERERLGNGGGISEGIEWALTSQGVSCANENEEDSRTSSVD